MENWKLFVYRFDFQFSYIIYRPICYNIYNYPYNHLALGYLAYGGRWKTSTIIWLYLPLFTAIYHYSFT